MSFEISKYQLSYRIGIFQDFLIICFLRNDVIVSIQSYISLPFILKKNHVICLSSQESFVQNDAEFQHRTIGNWYTLNRHLYREVLRISNLQMIIQNAVSRILILYSHFSFFIICRIFQHKTQTGSRNSCLNGNFFQKKKYLIKNLSYFKVVLYLWKLL